MDEWSEMGRLSVCWWSLNVLYSRSGHWPDTLRAYYGCWPGVGLIGSRCRCNVSSQWLCSWRSGRTSTSRWCL